MTNKEKYQRAFSALHSSQEIHLEECNMKKTHRLALRPVLAAAISVILLLSLATVAYAANVGGIRTTIQSWIRGRETTMAVTEKAPGQYEFQIQQDGENRTMSGGGLSFDIFGNPQPLPAEDVARNLSQEIGRMQDGKIWLYYNSYAIDITQYMTDQGCKLLLNDNGTKLYFDIEAPDASTGSCGYSRCQNRPDFGENPEDYIPIN